MTPADNPVSAHPVTQVLDVRDIEARDRHEMIFTRLGELIAGRTLRLVNDHDPIPLRYQLEAEQPDRYRWVDVESGPERWVVDITSTGFENDAEETDHDNSPLPFHRS